jgi:holo-[acyl-carrier protein] synthase
VTPRHPRGTIVGIGIDVVDIERLRLALDRTGGLADRLFRAAERERAASSSDPVPALASWFAAKESVMKALGRGISAIAFTDIEVAVAPDVVGQVGAVGAVAVVLHGRARDRADELAVGRIDVSVSHAGPLAQAVAVASV